MTLLPLIFNLVLASELSKVYTEQDMKNKDCHNLCHLTQETTTGFWDSNSKQCFCGGWVTFDEMLKPVFRLPRNFAGSVFIDKNKYSEE